MIYEFNTRYYPQVAVNFFLNRRFTSILLIIIAYLPIIDNHSLSIFGNHWVLDLITTKHDLKHDLETPIAVPISWLTPLCSNLNEFSSCSYCPGCLTIPQSPWECLGDVYCALTANPGHLRTPLTQREISHVC